MKNLLLILSAAIMSAIYTVQAEPVPEEILNAVNEVAAANGLHPRKPHFLLEQFIPTATADEEQRSQMAKALLTAFISKQTTPAGRTILAQHLAKVASDEEFRVLKKMEGDAQTMADVRIALNQLAESSVTKEPKAVYLTALKSRDEAEQIAGPAGIAQFYPKDADDIAALHITSDSEQVAAFSMRILAENDSSKLVKALPSLDKCSKITALAIVEEQKISEARKLTQDLAAADDPDIKAAAIEALGAVGDGDSVKLLTNAGAVEALTKLDAQGVNQAVLKAINSGSTESRITAMKAATMRGCKGLEQALLIAADGEDAKTACTALKALGRNGTDKAYPKLVPLLGGENSEDVESAVRRIAKRLDDKEAALEPLVNHMNTNDIAKKVAVLRCLSALGSDQALTVVSKNSASSNRDLKDAAVRALTQWPDAAVIPLLKRVMDNPHCSVVHRTLCERAIKRFESAGARAAALAMVNCGVDNKAKGASGIRITVKGRPWKYTDDPAGTIAFDNSELAVDVSGLDAKKQYQFGFTWWDYDNNGRVQSIQVGKTQVLGKTALPAWKEKKQPAVSMSVNIPASEIKEGKTTIRFQRAGRSNCVVSEVWISEGEAAATPTPLPVAFTATAKITDPAPQTDPNKFGPPVLKANRNAPRKVLVVTGNEYPGHPWGKTAPAIVKFLAEDKRLEVSYTEDYTILASKDIFKYDSLFLNYQNHGEPGPTGGIENLTEYLNGGGGLVLFHFACGAFITQPGKVYNPEFMKIAGRSWNPKLRGHDPNGSFTVTITDRSHPITNGMTDFTQTKDELYTCLDGDAPIHILATAVSKIDNKTYPMAFTYEPGKGKVFHCVLGHNLDAFSPAMNELYRRGTAWSAGL